MSTPVRIWRRFAAFTFAVLLSIQPVVAGEPAKLLPVDEASRDKALSAYRSRLLILIANRDANGLAASVSPAIKLSFGGMAGRDHLLAMLTGNKAERTWANLQRVLENGGRFLKDGSFAAPYWSEADYGADADPFLTYTVSGNHVPVYASPDASSTPAFYTTHDIVRSINDNGRSALVHVSFADNRNGFITRTNLASPIGYRSRFEKTATGWRLITFLSGD